MLAATRTVVKVSENQGRQFHKCGNNDACKFFAWADAPVAGPLRATGPPVFAPPNQAGGAPFASGKQCNCPAFAVQREVQKEGPNQGRKFWACLKPREEACGFFEWVDNNNGRSGGSGPRSGGGGGGSSGQECFKVKLIALLLCVID